jgi:hypothetical protein
MAPIEPKVNEKMDRLPEDQKADLHEVADLMLEIYQTLAKMRYIDASQIVQGPHDITETLSHYDDGETILGLDPAIKYLYTILPYVNTGFQCNSEFFGRSEFANFTDGEHIAQMRNPWAGRMESITEQMGEGRWMRPFVTPLALFGDGDEGTMIIYDSRSHQIWLLRVENWECIDLALEGVETPGWDVPTTTFGGLRHRFDYFPCRPAGDVLRDIVKWYRELKVLPGGGENSDNDWTHYSKDLDMKEMYRKHGWPDNLDSDAFEMDLVRSYAAHCAKEAAPQPLRDLEMWQQNIARAETHLLKQKKAVDDATNHEDEWLARFDVWKSTQNLAKTNKNCHSAKEEAERLCPNGVCQKEEDLPLWEVEFVRRDLKYKQDEVLRQEKWLRDALESDRGDEDDARKQLFHAKKREGIRQRALRQAQAVAERLCTGQTFQSATGIDSEWPPSGSWAYGEVDVSTKKQLESAQEWLLTVPSDIVKAKEKMASEISNLESILRFREEVRSRQEKGLDWKDLFPFPKRRRLR